jgi:Holliday junction resolvase-like predicted endonuclease
LKIKIKNEKDALALETLHPRKSHKMIKEIEYFLEKRNISNRKLARDVAEWVDIAVSQSHGHPTATADDPSYDTEIGDLDIENDTEN